MTLGQTAPHFLHLAYGEGNTALHADDPGTAWPWPVIDSAPADTTTPRAAELGLDAVAATVATIAASQQEPRGASPLPRPAHGLGCTKPRDTRAAGA